MNRRDGKSRALPRKLNAVEFDKSPANPGASNRIRGLQCAIAARPIRGIVAVSIHTRDRASSSATFACRRRCRVHGPLRPPVRQVAGRPCHGSKPCSARQDGLRQAIPLVTSPADDELDRGATLRTSTAWRLRALEEYMSDKKRKKGCWRSLSPRCEPFLRHRKRLAARVQGIEARNSSVANRFRTIRFRRSSGAPRAARRGSEQIYLSPPQPQPATVSRVKPAAIVW